MRKRTIGILLCMAVLAFASGRVSTAIDSVYAAEESDTSDDEEDEEDGIQIQSFPKDPVEVREDVKEVLELYPFLSAEFVEDVLEKNEELMKEYPEDTLVCVMHKMTFADLRTLLEFEMIMTDAGYICTQIDKEALEVSRRFFSEDGAVISDILNVANQVNALHGTYEGYVLD